MPRTRIRAKAPLVINTGGTQVVDGGNPAGSSLTVDSIGSIDIGAAAEPAATPAEAALFALSLTSSETSAAPTEAEQFFAIMQGVGDAAATPTDGDSAVARVGASTVAASVTQGSGWANPNNAAGIDDTVNAVLTGPAGLNPAAQNATLTLSYAATQLQEGATLVSVTVFATVNPAALGGAASITMSVSTDGGANYGTTTSVAVSNTGPFFLSSTGITAANLAAGGVRVRIVGTAQGTAVVASTVTVDAAVITFNA